MNNLPPFSEFPELFSDRIVLTALDPDRISEVLDILTYDGRPVQSITEGDEVCSKIHENYLQGNDINWVIGDLSTGQLLGFIGYYRGFENQTGEIGFILKPSYRGKGIMSAAIKLVVAFGLETMKLKRVHAYTREENKEAIAVLSRNGFSRNKEKQKNYLVFSFKKSEDYL